MQLTITNNYDGFNPVITYSGCGNSVTTSASGIQTFISSTDSSLVGCQINVTDASSNVIANLALSASGVFAASDLCPAASFSTETNTLTLGPTVTFSLNLINYLNSEVTFDAYTNTSSSNTCSNIIAGCSGEAATCNLTFTTVKSNQPVVGIFLNFSQQSCTLIVDPILGISLNNDSESNSYCENVGLLIGNTPTEYTVFLKGSECITSEECTDASSNICIQGLCYNESELLYCTNNGTSNYCLEDSGGCCSSGSVLGCWDVLSGVCCPFNQIYVNNGQCCDYANVYGDRMCCSKPLVNMVCCDATKTCS